MKKLKEEEENKDKDIRIEDGVLKVDGRAVDKNTFLSKRRFVNKHCYRF